MPGLQSILTDTHSHLYSEQFADDRDEMIQRALAEKVKRFFMPNVDASSVAGMKALANQYPEHCFPMIGLHPCSVGEDYEKQLDAIEEELNKTDKGFPLNKYFAIGEIGLDYYWDKTHIDLQKAALRRQIGWAIEHGLPIIMHSRESFDDLFDIVSDMKTDGLTGIFHCFTGSIEQAEKVMELGFFMGIGGVVTFKNSGLAEVVKNIPLEYIVLETDAPYLAPVPHRGKRNESAYIKLVAEKVAEIKGISVDEVASITTRNAERIFKI